MKLHVLIDNLSYIQSNCYQHQLFKTLSQECELTFSTIDDILKNKKISSNHDRILSCLKLRTINNNVHTIKRFLDNREIYIYEQDPWESFKDDSQYKGSYHKIYNELNVLSFLNTSKWWSDFINSQGIRSKFVKMWMLPEYCSAVPNLSSRQIDLGFCGQLHPYRKKFFDYLKSEGIVVEVMKPAPYQEFLQNLSNIKIYVHNEQVNWQVNGKNISANALWIKDVEAAARGCISIRDYEEELENYVPKNNISTIMTYDSFENAIEVIRRNLKEVNQLQDKIIESVNAIKNDVGWKTVIKALE